MTEASIRRNDPLAVGHDVLVAATREAAIQLRALGPLGRWLDAVGFPPGPRADRLDAEADALEKAHRGARRKRAVERGARAVRQQAAADARTWLRALRATAELGVIQGRPGSDDVLAGLRALGRLHPTIAGTRRALASTRDALCAAGPSWAHDRDQAERHHAALAEVDGEIRTTREEHDARVEALRVAREALVAHLRELHAAWRAAEARSQGELLPLVLHELVWTPRRHRRRPDDEAPAA